MRRPLFAILLLSCLTLTAFCQEEELAVHVNELRVPQMMGVVTTHGGRPVVGVRVEVFRREDGHIMGEARTDAQGRFAYPHLKPHRYNIKVHHNGIADFYHVRVTTQNAAPELVLRYKH